MLNPIKSLEPSLPWSWMAILTKETAISDSMDPNGSAKALSAVASLTTALSNIMSGDLSSFLWSGTGQFGKDTLFSSLMQSVQLPSAGFTLQYEDLGFIRYPTVGQINTEPLTVDYLETADNLVSRYYQDWMNDCAPVIATLKSTTPVVTDPAGNTFAVVPAGDSTLFAPLASVSRTLFIIKTKRDVSTGLISYLLNFLNTSPTGGIGDIVSGFPELPVQIYCFPKVFPQKTTEAKLDKSETNSIRTFQVILERVPSLTYIISKAQVSQLSLLMSVTLGWAGVVSSLSGSLLGLATVASNSIQALSQTTKLYSKSDAAALVDISQQPERNDAR